MTHQMPAFTYCAVVMTVVGFDLQTLLQGWLRLLLANGHQIVQDYAIFELRVRDTRTSVPVAVILLRTSLIWRLHCAP